jgi:hypothetical protein
VTIQSIAQQSGEAWAALACWEPADPNDLFDLLRMLHVMLEDVEYGLKRAAERVSRTGVHPGCTELLDSAKLAVHNARVYATDLEAIARI